MHTYKVSVKSVKQLLIDKDLRAGYF